jgi:hypothetical protein
MWPYPRNDWNHASDETIGTLEHFLVRNVLNGAHPSTPLRACPEFIEGMSGSSKTAHGETCRTIERLNR